MDCLGLSTHSLHSLSTLYSQNSLCLLTPDHWKDISQIKTEECLSMGRIYVLRTHINAT